MVAGGEGERVRKGKGQQGLRVRVRMVKDREGKKKKTHTVDSVLVSCSPTTACLLLVSSARGCLARRFVDNSRRSWTPLPPARSSSSLSAPLPAAPRRPRRPRRPGRAGGAVVACARPEGMSPTREVEIGALPPSRTCLALSLLQLPLHAAPRSSGSSQPTLSSQPTPSPTLCERRRRRVRSPQRTSRSPAKQRTVRFLLRAPASSSRSSSYLSAPLRLGN
jgi:hypothetical protein